MAELPRGGAPATPEFRAPERSAQHYTTSPTARPVRGDARTDEHRQTLLDLARERGLELEGDGRLAELAAWVASHVDHDKFPPSPVIDFYSRHLGLADPVPFLIATGTREDQTWRASVADLLAQAPKNIPFNRFGIATGVTLGQRVTVVALSASRVRLAPVERKLARGGALLLRGRLHDRYRDPSVVVTSPAGVARTVAGASGSELDVELRFAEAGVHRVEIMAAGPFGPEVVALFPVFVDVDEPRSIRPESGGAAPVDRASVAQKLVALINQARSSAGVPPLEVHDGLAEVAAGHSRDMNENGFFGHVSPVHGDQLARMSRSTIPFARLGENLGRGATAEDIHEGLLASPAHRAVMLDPAMTHVGVGVELHKIGSMTEVIATEQFATLRGAASKPASAGLVATPEDALAHVNIARLTGGVKAVQQHPMLGAVAKRLASGPANPSEQELTVALKRALEEERGGRRQFQRISVKLMKPATAEVLAAQPEVLDGDVTHVGVAIAPAREGGAEPAALVLVMGRKR